MQQTKVNFSFLLFCSCCFDPLLAWLCFLNSDQESYWPWSALVLSLSDSQAIHCFPVLLSYHFTLSVIHTTVLPSLLFLRFGIHTF